MSTASLPIVGSATRTFPFSVGTRVLSDPTEGLFFLAEPRPGGEKVKEAIERATKRVRAYYSRFHYWRAFDIWYRKAHRVEDYEVEAIIQAAEAKDAKDIRDEVYELRSRLRRIESLLVSQDPEFHRPSIDHAGEMVRRLGGKDGA